MNPAGIGLAALNSGGVGRPCGGAWGIWSELPHPTLLGPATPKLVDRALAARALPNVTYAEMLVEFGWVDGSWRLGEGRVADRPSLRVAGQASSRIWRRAAIEIDRRLVVFR